MSRIVRAIQKIFGLGQPTDISQFGSKSANAYQQTTDVPTIQALPAWSNGWRSGLISNSISGLDNVAGLQDQNAVNYVTTFQLAYLLQEGIPEWEVNTAYFSSGPSVVKNPGTTQIYKCISDNTGQPLSNGTYWILLGDLSNLVNAESPPFNYFPDYTSGVTLDNNTIYHASQNGWVLIAGKGVVSVGTTSNPTQLIGLFNSVDNASMISVYPISKGVYYNVSCTGYYAGIVSTWFNCIS